MMLILIVMAAFRDHLY